MKKVFFCFFLLVGSVCTFTACDNDDDDDNNSVVTGTVVFGNENYRFFTAWYDSEYGDDEDDFSYIDIMFDLLTENKAASINLDGLDPYDYDVRNDLGDDLTELYFSLIYRVATALPKAGTYTVDIDSYKDMTISQGYFGNYDIVSGSCKISSSGNIYTIEMDFVCENNKTLKGTYKGILKDYDE